MMAVIAAVVVVVVLSGGVRLGGFLRQGDPSSFSQDM
jgi:hypothetical protein